MAIYPIACKEMATRRKKLYYWILSFGIGDGWQILIITLFEFMVSNNIYIYI